MEENRMDMIEIIYKKVPLRLRVCFISGIVAGLLTHMVMLTHKLPNWDDVGNFHGYGVGSEFGRWFLRFLHPLAGTWSNPWINGCMTIFLLAAAICFFYEGLELKSITSAVLLPLIFMTFPSLAGTMTYMFTVDCYGVSICLAALSFYLVRRCKYGFVWGIIPLVFSMGIYQSYICLTISAMIIALFVDAVQREDGFGQLMKRGISYAVTLAGATIFYYLIAVWRFPMLTQMEHNGIGAMGHISLLRFPKLIVKAYLRFARYFLFGGYSFQSRFMHTCNILVLVVLAVLFVAVIWIKKIYRQKGNLVFILLCCFLFPLGMSFVDIMAPDSNFSVLMIYQFAFFYGAVLVLYEMLYEYKEKWIRLAAAAGVCLVLLTSYGDYLVTNEAYFRMKISYERVYAYLTRMMTRVESMEGYQTGDSILVMGTFEQATLNGCLMDEERFYDFSGIAVEYGLMTPGARENFIRIYFGLPMEYYSESVDEEIKSTQEFQEMSVYPSGNSIKKIGSRWIVRIS